VARNASKAFEMTCHGLLRFFIESFVFLLSSRGDPRFLRHAVSAGGFGIHPALADNPADVA
jgi:hypothetical protein